MSQEHQVKPKLVAVPTPSPSQGSQKVFARASVFFNNIGYCSLSEAVCGTLLELFVPGFKIIEGQTFQIALGNGSSVDFFVNGVLVEFHGVRFQAERGRFGDFNSRQEYVQYNRRLRQLRGNRYKRQQFMDLTRERLMQNYFQRRRRLIDQHEAHKRCELVVVSNCDEFYDMVVRRFNRTFCPNRAEFRQIFYALVKVVARQNSVSKHQFNRERARA
ncbi:MAG: hypothetical protein J0M12_02010 [Deltaproteobacteria bacterium]|nr:hypothetical protein [Deltaproteobacteria bacterium]